MLSILMQGGEINSYLEQVLGLRDFSDLTDSVHHKGDTVLMYGLERSEETIATVVNLLCEGTSKLLKLSVYTPVLEPGKKKWIVGHPNRSL